MDAVDQNALEQLLELIGGDRESLVELINTFLTEGQEIVTDMHNAQPDQNVELLRRSAHSLKSSAQDFGAIKLSESCAFLEYNCKSGWPESTDEQVTTISAQFSAAATSLREYLADQ